MNPKIFATLEFNRIQADLAKHTSTQLGKRLALKLAPMTDPSLVQAAWQDISEWDILAQNGHRLPISQLADIKPATDRLDRQASLNGEELGQIMQVLDLTNQLVKFFADIEEASELVPQLYKLSQELLTLSAINRQLKQSISPTGEVFDSASKELREIRQSISREERQIRQKLDDYTKSKSSYLSDQLVTIRNGRFVLPVKAEYKRAVGGVIHDQSASGQTLYIEPPAVVEANSRLQNLYNDEQYEIMQIFMALSAALAPYTKELKTNNQVLAQFDFIKAKYLYGKAIKANRPKLAGKEENFALYQAVHPYLDAKTAVANDIVLDADQQMLLITGPNTGGKTITLKTVGLLHLMGQSGLYITAQAGSKINIFKEIFADIGDEQSIEQNLSTFSGHMTNVISILNQADQDSLVLVDELGSGTDPQEGAALAMAILDRFAAHEVTVLATTHYPELKLYAYDHDQVTNASMVFDEISLRPTYQLLIGVPGRSNAFDISARLGLDPDIVAQARSQVDQDARNLNDMLLDLEDQRQDYENKEKMINQRLNKADRLLHDLKVAHQAMQDDKDKYMDRARQEAKEYVDQKKSEADRLMAEIRAWQTELGNQGQHIKEHQLIDQRKAFETLSPEARQLKSNKVLRKAKRNKEKVDQIQVGDQVKVIPYGQTGEVVEARDDNQFIVQMGILKMELPASDLEKIASPDKGPAPKAQVQRSKSKGVSTQLDLRGERYEAALNRLDQFIDAALLANHPRVTIVHGHGTGALREGVQKYLRKHPRVKSFEFAPYNQGGNGATIAHFVDKDSGQAE
ncbi:DNA mismatch repair protein MutS [Aerococcus urinaehominis]|uniref:Endonuclease MutS2 n=1 Tax=Aerococcus urinaehominis TaxID=128944 RepID=A0A120IAP3_9LACT|nr:endonuclease MutS2 [Aerococcus urinaehominis]AMB98708.1 DNA mismatch repair protein MutS [Aerococcus urinaehominis]SDL99477.1 DNA mismatch repair protein MutS2 [Aerococcus urinaehominis]